ncbi:MAG: sulfite exporter TauE/SafE family protein [Steroidobacteraceae bacterium]|jgi:uncharacterized membrane protein YfcA|nr:sulfite exporter TauE/SafE family protein [Steroidobacteraceae bacterium]
MTAELLMLVALVALAGAFGGVLAGLLGVGGGIVIVPVLEFALGAAGVPADVRMHLAVGTSLASIVPTALSSSRAHRRRGAVDEQIARRWIPPIAAGAAAGAVAAAFVSGGVLRAVFGVVALAVAAVMLLRPEPQAAGAGRTVTPGPRGWPAGIGFVSALMGIGGGTLSVPALSRRGLPIHRAVGTSAWLGLWIALPAAAGFAWLGLGRPGLPPGCLGFVSLPGLAVLVPASVLAAPFGARIAHGLSRRALRAAFGVFLLLVALRMLWGSLAA